MDQVERGDAIFMLAKGVGIVGIGCATAKRQILAPGDPDRIGTIWKGGSLNGDEWRVPVYWLDWRDEKDACLCTGLNSTFWNRTLWNVTDNATLRDTVRRHFLGDQ